MKRPTLSRIAALLIVIALLLPAAIPAYADSTSLNMESYTLGTINGQDGWSMTGPFDVAVVDNTYGYSSFGTKSLRISDAVTSGSFGDQTFVKPLVNAVGETAATAGTISVGTRQTRFEMQFDIASTQAAQQVGMHVSVSPDRGDGSRMSYLRFDDGPAGIDVFFDDVQQLAPCTPASCALFVETQIGTGLSRTTPHNIKLTMDTLDGPSNDVVKVFIDGALVKTGTSWEDYYRYDPEAAPEASPRFVKTVLFRASGTATPANAGKGYLIDNLTTTSVRLPSTNDQNRINGWAHVDQTAVGLGSTTLTFTQPRAFYACFEYRTDGDTSQKISNTNYNPDITDGLYPYVCLSTAGATSAKMLSASQYVEVRMVFGAEDDERFDWTRFDVGTGVNVSNLQPSWTAPGAGGVYAAYYGPASYNPVSPGLTAAYDGREAGIIKAGLAKDLTSGNYEDEGLLGFQVDNVAIAAFAAQTFTFDVQNESGPNPVWVRIRLVDGAMYQFVPATNPTGWHTVDAAAGQWQLMDSAGNATGQTMTLSELAAASQAAQVDRVYLTLGMGNSYYVRPGVGTVGWVDKVTIGLKTYDFVVASAAVDLTTPNSLFCVGKNTTINVNLNNVTNLYGYQVKVGFDPAKATASDAAFDNTWFNTAVDAFIPTGYNKDCSVAGTCAFGASKFLPATPLTGSGKIASFKLTATTLGAFDVTITEAILTDKDGFAPAVRTITLPLTVCGNATVNGIVALQGRSTPMDAGSVTLTDLGTTFGPITVPFDKDSGAWTANVQYMPGGSNYTVDALHSLYLTNEKTPVTVAGNVTLPKTTLRGGDANNDGTVQIGDLSCIGGAFGGSSTCEGTGSSDINKDGATNIQDLSIAGGNFDKHSPLDW